MKKKNQNSYSSACDVTNYADDWKKNMKNPQKYKNRCFSKFDTVACMKVIFELSFQFLEGKRTYYLTISAKFLTRIEK